MRVIGVGLVVAIVVAAIAYWWPSGADGEELPFEGATIVELDCIDERRAPSESELDRLIEAVLEAYGGGERWKTLEYRMSADVYHHHTGDIMSNRAKKTVFCSYDDSYRADLKYRSGLAKRVLNHGDAYLALRGGEIMATRGDGHVLLWWEYETMRIPHRLVLDQTTLTGLAPEEVDGRWLIPVVIDDANRPEVTIYIDPVGPVIRQSRGTIPLSAAVLSGKVSEDLTHVYSEFEVFDGILVPKRIDTFAEGNRSSLVELHEFSVAQSIEDAIFLPE